MKIKLEVENGKVTSFVSKDVKTISDINYLTKFNNILNGDVNSIVTPKLTQTVNNSDEVAALNRTIAELKAKINAIESENNTLRDKLSSVKSNNSKLTRQLEDRVAQNDGLKATNNNLRETIKGLEASVKTLQDSNKQLEVTISQKDNEIETLNNAIKECEDKSKAEVKQVESTPDTKEVVTPEVVESNKSVSIVEKYNFKKGDKLVSIPDDLPATGTPKDELEKAFLIQCFIVLGGEIRLALKAGREEGYQPSSLIRDINKIISKYVPEGKEVKMPNVPVTYDSFNALRVDIQAFIEEKGITPDPF
jgi:cell division protein FtsB